MRNGKKATMFDPLPASVDWFSLANVREKLADLPAALAQAMIQTRAKKSFELGRDVRVVGPAELPPKPGLSKVEGQARLLHDLASIELQAMELAVRTLCEYPEAPAEFRKELSEIAAGEGRHLALCLDRMEAMGFAWGHWDVHLTLWNTVGPQDTLLDRILIVHRYLEGSGLDSGESILRRLVGVAGARAAKETVELIMREEVDHVLFGSRWYRTIAEQTHIDPETDFRDRIAQIAQIAPRRDRVARELRRQAGFTPFEIAELERLIKNEVASHPSKKQ